MVDRTGQSKRLVQVERSDGRSQGYWKWTLDDDYQINIVEWTFNFMPTRGDNRPSSGRDWEVRIQAPENIPQQQIRAYADQVLSEEMSEFGGESMVDTATVYSKVGSDYIESTDTPYTRYKIVDKKRPQYSYPREGWGSIDE